MKRIASYLLLLGSAAIAYACSDSSAVDPADGSPETTDPPAADGEDAGVAVDDDAGGGDGGPAVEPGGDDPTGSPILLGAPRTVRTFTPAGGDPQFVDGPQWSPTRQALFVALPLAQSTLGGGGKGVLTTFKADGTNFLEVRAGDSANTGVVGNTIDKDGNLVSAELRVITRTAITQSGPIGGSTVIATGTSTGPADPVVPFNGPNDLVVRDDGMIFVTDPGYNITPRPANGYLYMIAPAATYATIADTYGDNPSPNGIAFSKDQKSLFVSFTAPPAGTLPFVRKYVVAADGSLANSGKFAELPDGSSPDGIAVDDDDNLVVATNTGLCVFKSTGEPYGGAAALPQVKLPSGATGVTYGGTDRKSVFVTTSDGKVLELKSKVAGLLQ